MEALISKPNGKLGIVEIFTIFGEEHVFPGMDVAVLQRVLPKGSNCIPAATPTLSMVNASFAVISIPFCNISTIKVEGELWWSSPASTARKK